MSKSNVNPNHYKVAGRERQGEDIAQIRNRQKHAESLVRMRFEPRTPQTPPLAAEAPQTEPPRAARKTVTRKQAPAAAKPRKLKTGTAAPKKTAASSARSSRTSRTPRRPAAKTRQR